MGKGKGKPRKEKKKPKSKKNAKLTPKEKAELKHEKKYAI